MCVCSSVCYMIGLLSVKLYAVAVLPNAGYRPAGRACYKRIGFPDRHQNISTHVLISGYETNPFFIRH
jgi:hypothetical protein